MKRARDPEALNRVRALLSQEGIDSLDALAERILDDGARTLAPPEELLRGRILPETAAGPLQWRTERLEGPYRHWPNELPVLLDDSRMIEPGAIQELDGMAVDFVWDQSCEERNTLRAFSISQEAAEYMRSIPVRDSLPENVPAAIREILRDISPSFHVGGTPAVFCEHVNFQGASRTLDLGHVFPDLTTEWMSGILWWWTSWNDQMSSAASGSGWVTLWEHVYPPQYGYPPGSKMHIAPFGVVSSLVPFGWNDRVSAINHHFFAE
jgi:hypothetical protein